MSTEGPSKQALWIFGYGSLMWRPGFAFAERRAGFITGWTRRFWQGSTDHRGVPGDPGRVVTVIPQPGARCWGQVFRVKAEAAQGVLEQLDHREQAGYERVSIDVAVTEGPPVKDALMYLATPQNPNYVGPAPLDTIVDQVRRCRGPSGPNIEYALRLAEALEAIGAEDEHVFALAACLRR